MQRDTCCVKLGTWMQLSTTMTERRAGFQARFAFMKRIQGTAGRMGATQLVADQLRSSLCVFIRLLWKHWDFRQDVTEVRRKRQLVISFIATVGNYEYAFYWKFSRDGVSDIVPRFLGWIVVLTQLSPCWFSEFRAGRQADGNHQH